MNPKSQKPRKQRAFSHSLALHLQQKRLKGHASKEVRKETGKRSIALRKGDTVQVLRGSFGGKSGKIASVLYREGKITIEKMVRKKANGKEAFVPIHASNVLVMELSRENTAKAGKTSAKKEDAKEPVKAKTQSALKQEKKNAHKKESD